MDYKTILELLLTGCLERDLKRIIRDHREREAMLETLRALKLLKEYEVFWIEGSYPKGRVVPLAKAMQRRVVTRRQLELMVKNVDLEIYRLKRAGYRVHRDILYILKPVAAKLLQQEGK